MNGNKNKLLIPIILILLVANITLLVLFLQKSKGDKQHGRQNRKAHISAFLKKEIGFNEKQLSTFDTMSDNQMQKIAAIVDKEKVSKAAQFKELRAANFSDTAIFNLSEKSATTQKITNAMMLTHIKEIRMLCMPNQLGAFDSLFHQVLERRSDKEIKNKE